MDTATYTITGTGAGLLMHSDAGLDPRNPILAEQRAITKKGTRNRTEAEQQELQRLEFLLGLYWAEETGPYLPAHMIEACLRDAAKARKLGKEFSRSVMLAEDRIPLGYDGPRDKKALWDKGFYDARSVKVGQSRVLRTRPHFPDWSATFSVIFDPDHLDPATIAWSVETAGQRIGIGDFRPRFGRFVIAA